MLKTKGYEQLLYEIDHWQHYLIYPHLLSGPAKGVIQLQITKLEQEVHRRTQPKSENYQETNQ